MILDVYNLSVCWGGVDIVCMYHMSVKWNDQETFAFFNLSPRLGPIKKPLLSSIFLPGWVLGLFASGL